MASITDPERVSPTLAPSRGIPTSTTNRPRSSHASLQAQNAVTSAHGAQHYAASDAKKDAAEMMATLGINNNSELVRASGSTIAESHAGVRREVGTMGRAAGKRNSMIGSVATSNLLDERIELLASSTSSPAPDLANHLQTTLNERERELAVLQAKYDQLAKDKNREFLALQTKYDQLERESNEVERLLTGYQHEAEKSSLAVEAMKNKHRRIGDVLRTIYGDDWEKEILDRPSNASNFASLASPAQRKLPNRPGSIIRTNKQLRRESHIADNTINSTIILEEHSPDREPNDGSHALDDITSMLESAAREGPSAEDLASHMAAIRDLFRGIERRLIERDLELVETEQRANEHAVEAEEKSKALTEMVEALAV